MAVGSEAGGVLALGFHFAGFLCLCHSLWYIYQPSPMTTHFATLVGGRSNFLTMWGLTLSWLAFATKLVLHLGPPGRGYLQRFHATVNLITLPLESLVTVLYWSVMVYDPSLMIPYEPVVAAPLSLDLALHFQPAVLLWLDHIFFAPTLGASRPTIAFILFGLAYSSWVEICSAYGNNGQFPYPFLTLVSRPVRYGIYSSAVILCLLIHSLASSAHRHRPSS